MKSKDQIPNFHLTMSDRILIEQELRDGATFKEISRKVGKDPTTISKEVKRVVNACDFKDDPIDCAFVRSCRRTDLCMGTKCSTYCKDCYAVRCTEVCERWAPKNCAKLLHPPYVCNPCRNVSGCKLEKKFYRAKEAQKQYESKLSDSRKGVNLTREELEQLNNLVTPLIRRNQSLGHIYATHEAEIGVSRATLYKYIAEGILDVKTLDLPRKVRYKKRKRAGPSRKTDYKYRSGRTYRHFLRFLEENPGVEVVEMDTVKGSRTKGPCLLTMLFRRSCLMLLFLLKDCTADSVVHAFDILTEMLGAEEFSNTFPVFLTDNGAEFTDSERLECTDLGELRTRIFYCDPQQSNQKSRLEKNHEYIRYVLPKGVPMYWMTKEKVNLLMTHINSVKRDSLNKHSPYEIAKLFMKAEVLELLHITCVPPDQVHLKPALLK